MNRLLLMIACSAHYAFTGDSPARVPANREIIGLADRDALDLLRSRTVEQDVLDILDEPSPR